MTPDVIEPPPLLGGFFWDVSSNGQFFGGFTGYHCRWVGVSKEAILPNPGHGNAVEVGPTLAIRNAQTCEILINSLAPAVIDPTGDFRGYIGGVVLAVNSDGIGVGAAASQSNGWIGGGGAAVFGGIEGPIGIHYLTSETLAIAAATDISNTGLIVGSTVPESGFVSQLPSLIAISVTEYVESLNGLGEPDLPPFSVPVAMRVGASY